MNLADLNAAIRWAEKEGWNPIVHAANAYYASDPRGYFLLKNHHATLATLSKVKYDQGLVFMGFYMVDPLLRSQGYGKYLWDNVTETFVNDGYIGLDGVVAQIKNYQTSGFELYVTTSRYRYDNNKHQAMDDLSASITLSTDFVMSDLIAYDQSIFSQNRTAFLKHWLQLPSAIRLMAYHKQNLCGYGQLVKAIDGYRVSPLFADSADIALYLFDKLCQSLPEHTPIYIDIPDNHEAVPMFIKLFKPTKISESARMYYQGKQPQRLIHKEFGRTTLELG